MSDSRTRQTLSPVVEDHADLTFVGDNLVVVPVRHFLRTVNISEISERKPLLGVWGVHALWSLEDDAQIWNFIEPGHRATQLRSDVLRIDIGEWVSWDRSRKEVLEVTLPFLRRIETIDDLIEVARDQRNPCSNNDYILFYVELAAGHFDVALEILSRCRDEWFHEKDYYWSARDVSEDIRLRQLERLLLSGSYDRIGKVLRHWEERCARRAGVRHLWQPSPFPFEPDYGEWQRRSSKGTNR